MIHNVPIKEALTTMYIKKDKEVKYGISDLKYDIQTNLIKIQEKDDNMVKITTTTTTTTTSNANIEDSTHRPLD